MHIAHEIQLLPSKRQEQYFRQACGIARSAYNTMLAHCDDSFHLFKRGELDERWFPSRKNINKYYNRVRKLLRPWTYDVTKHAGEKACADLANAWDRFLIKKVSKKPKFKKRKHGYGQFSMSCRGETSHIGRRLKMPNSRKLGVVRTTCFPRFSGVIKRITVKERAGKWYASIMYDVSTPPTNPHAKTKRGVVGVDLGIKVLATASDGTIFENPRVFVNAQKDIARAQRALSRKVKGSNNYKKQIVRLQRKHKRSADLRKNHIHNLTSYLSKNYRKIVIEDLNVRGMSKNRNLSKHILDVGFHEVRRQLEYKCKWYDTELEIASRWFASSKICSRCGFKKQEFLLSKRKFSCENCGLLIDRDLNAAINLKNLAGDAPVSACGEESAGNETKSVAVKLSSVKQELIKGSQQFCDLGD